MSRSGEEEPLPLMAMAPGVGACHTLTTLASGAGGAGGAFSVRRAPRLTRWPPPHHEPPPLPAASFLTIICVLLVFYHYYSLVLFYVLSSASRSHRPPCAPGAAQIIAACNYVAARWRRAYTLLPLTPSCDGWPNSTYQQTTDLNMNLKYTNLFYITLMHLLYIIFRQQQYLTIKNWLFRSFIDLTDNYILLQHQYHILCSNKWDQNLSSQIS